MAYVRSKTIKGKTYQYLVKSVREGKRVRQVFVSYIGNPPPASGRACQEAAASGDGPGVSALPDFTPLVGADVRVRYVMLLRQLGCPSVVFNLRARHKHGDLQAWRDLETGQVSIAKVRLHRDASAHAIAHEVGHVMDYGLQNALRCRRQPGRRLFEPCSGAAQARRLHLRASRNEFARFCPPTQGAGRDADATA